MKRIFAFILCLSLSISVFAGKPKYVFYFIGDGMGLNQVLMTELYLASIEGEQGVTPLCFADFPVASYATTFSSSSNVTDSAAAGTALSCGVKTRNGRLGVDAEGNPVKTLAEVAKEAGRQVAIVTTSRANDATPGAFVAHQPDRDWGYEISEDMIEQGFEFYGGSGLKRESKNRENKIVTPIRPRFEEAGYTICNPQIFRENYRSMEKVLMLPGEGQRVTYYIDTVNDLEENRDLHLTFQDFVECALTFLTQDRKKGFFMMAEAGEIDHACHSHDAATTIQEILDFNEGIKLALEFYKKHPKETLILVTADHETGGLTLEPKYPRHLTRLKNQKHSANVLSDMLKERMTKEKGILSWEEIRAFLRKELGLWDEVNVSWENEKMLRDIYEETIAKRDPGSAKDLYADNSKIIAAAVGLLNASARVYWTNGHSSGYVPVFALGQGAEYFTRQMDNTEIPELLKKAAF